MLIGIKYIAEEEYLTLTDRRPAMKRNISKIDYIIAGIAVVFVIIAIIFVISNTNKKNGDKSEQEDPSSTLKTHLVSDIVTEEPNTDIDNYSSDFFSAQYLKEPFVVNIPENLSVNESGAGIWLNKSDNEWFMYSFDNIDSINGQKENIKQILSLSDLVVTIINRQDGYIGLSQGGYISGTFTAGDKPYYIVSYYLAGIVNCAYMTTDVSKLTEGNNLIKENALTMILPSEYYEGTGDESDVIVDIDSDPYVKEFLNNAKYCEFYSKKDYNKMRLIFSCHNFENVEEIYVRRHYNDKNDEIYYPAENEECMDDEVVFVIDNVKENDNFDFVIFSDNSPGKVRATAVEYKESSHVKNESPDTDIVTISENE